MERTLVTDLPNPKVVRFGAPPISIHVGRLAQARHCRIPRERFRKLRALIDELIQVLGQEQKHVREEVATHQASRAGHGKERFGPFHHVALFRVQLL